MVAVVRVLISGVCCMRQARYENAYVHVMNVLKYLIDPSAGNASSLPSESSLSDAERREFLQTLLQVAPSALPSCLSAAFWECKASQPQWQGIQLWYSWVQVRSGTHNSDAHSMNRRRGSCCNQHCILEVDCNCWRQCCSH